MFYAWGDDWEANEQLFWCQIITADSKTPHDAVRDVGCYKSFTSDTEHHDTINLTQRLTSGNDSPGWRKREMANRWKKLTFGKTVRMK